MVLAMWLLPKRSIRFFTGAQNPLKQKGLPKDTKNACSERYESHTKGCLARKFCMDECMLTARACVTAKTANSVYIYAYREMTDAKVNRTIYWTAHPDVPEP